jgi:hypothetical protein
LAGVFGVSKHIQLEEKQRSEMNEIKELECKALTVPEKARSIQVHNSETYIAAGEILVEIKGLRKEINSTFDPIIKKAYEAHKEAKAQKTRAEAPLIEAENIIKPALNAYDSEQERIRRAEEMRLQEIARKQEEDRRLAEAAEIEKAGDKKLAEEILSAPVEVAPVIVAKAVPKLEGVYFTERWTFRIVNPAIIPREFLAVDTVKIGQYARAMKSAGRIPGVEIYSEKSVSGRG